MKILNFGSINFDYVYHVDHMIQPGETEATESRDVFMGGKGMNQSCALAKAGAEVYHAGLIGQDGQPFLDACEKYGIRSEYIKTTDGPTGHTIIQIDKNAQNSILLFGGANRKMTKDFIDEVLAHFEKDDILLLQNEINLIEYIVDEAYKKKMKIVLNPSPFDEKLQKVDLNKVSVFLLNEVEGGQITGKTENKEILAELLRMFPQAQIVLTLGKDGAIYADSEKQLFQPAFKVKAVDTTAAGDTFTGYFLAGMMQGLPMEEILLRSAKASSIAVTRQGAVPSIPYRKEVLESLH